MDWDSAIGQDISGILDAIDTLLVQVDVSGRVLSMNKKARELFGYSGEAAKGVDWFDVHAIDRDRETRKEAFLEFVSRKKNDSFEDIGAFATKAGYELPYRWRATFIAGGSGRPGSVLYAAISDDTRSIRAKAEAEAHLQSIIKALPLGVHQYELDDAGNLLFVGANPAADDILHVDHGKLIGLGILDAFPSLKETDIPAIYVAAARGADPVHKEVIDYKDEKIIGAFEVNAFNTGERKMAAVFSDILDRKKAEIDRDRFFEISEDMIIQGSIDGKYIDVNAAATRILGWSREKLLSGNWMDYIHPDDAKAAQEAIKDLFAGNRVIKIENRHRHMDGSYRWLSWTSMYVREEKKILSIVRDITEEKKRLDSQRQREKLEAIGQLAGGVAHDFNNQLAGIMGCAEIIQAKLPPGSDLQQYLGLIISSARTSADLAGQLLAFARKGKFQSQPIDVNAAIKEAAALLARTIDRKISIDLQLADTPIVIDGDPSQIQNLIMNLGLNARDAMPKGGSILFRSDIVESGKSAQDRSARPGSLGRFARISISDTGIGMDDTVREHLFEPFFTTKPEGRGTGLGLAAVYGIIKSHHGTVDVSSEKDRGTTFTLHFPLGGKRSLDTDEEGDDMESRQTAVPQPNSAASGDRETTVLIVDDEEVICLMVQAMLGLFGYKTATAKTGEEAKKYLEGHPCPDLVLLDMIMPDMNGEEVFSLIKQTHPDARVLISSGYSIDGAAQGLLDKGAKGFIQKPYRKDALKTAIETALKA